MTAWINEFHYDNVATDTGEFIEIAGVAGTDLNGWSVVRYNGSTASAAVTYTSPGSLTLSGVIPNQQNGFGTLAFFLPTDGLQNGPNDGFALVNGTTVVQLLSYEGVFTASNGPAAGQSSDDVGPSETSGTPVGASLHLVGTGDDYLDFDWAVTLDDSPGAVNAGQVFAAPVVVPKINEFVFNHVGTDTNEYVEVLAGAGADLSAYALIGIEGDVSGTATGVVDNVIALTVADAAGYWQTGFLANALENGTLTLLLVKDFTGSAGADLDTNDDGVLDVTPWSEITDAVAISDGGATDRTYGGAPVLAPGYDGAAFTPGGASRIPNGADTGTAADWVRNDFDLFGIPGFAGTPAAGEARNTPGAANALASAGITVSPTTVGATEGGATGSFTVVLTSAPTANVTIGVTGGPQVGVSTASLVFTSADWDVPQTVTVTAVDDSAIEGPHGATVTLGAAVSADPNYSGLDATDVTVSITDNDAAPVITRIHTVQGSGAASPLAGQTVTVEAIVVGDFQNGDADTKRNLGGFYLQEEDADADANPLTSEGIFVFQGGALGTVNIGDRVQVTGTVSEFFGMTQLSASSITVLGSGNALPTAAQILLPAAGTTLSQDGDVQPDLEAYEGMRVVFSQTLTVTEQFQLDRFNEIKLVAGDRPTQFTQENAPSVAGYQAALQEVGARTITYDDGLNQQNQSINNLDGFGPAYATATAPRMGDTVTGLTGVLDYQWAGNAASGATWRVRATEDGANTFADAAARPATPPDVGGTLKVASFNVLNFFPTLNTLNDSGADLPGDNTALGFDPRGANSAAEFARQAQKLFTTLDLLGADIIGLIELENDFLAGASGNAIEYIVEGLNDLAGGEVWSWVNPDTRFVGSDAIAVGLIYRNDAVGIATGTDVAILDTGLIAQDGRAPVAATFEDLDTGEVFTVTVNHFKSKGSAAGLPGDADQGDGQGLSNATRVAQAQELLDWLATDPTGAGDTDVLIIGDLNAYAKEDPIALLESAGYVNLEQPGDYSYVFDGLTGSLDHALASASLAAKVAGAAAWHINADEADALDYNLDFGRDPSIFDGTVPYRTSDHDPLLVGFDFVAPPATLTFDIWRIGTTAGDRAGWGGQVSEIAYRDDTTGGVSVTDARDADAPLDADGITVSAEDGDFGIYGIAFEDGAGNRRAGVDPLMTVEWDAAGQEASIALLRPWNAWKNIAVDSFDGTALAVDNFVHVFVALDEAEDDLEVAIQGAKRADVATGEGDDLIEIGIDSNQGARNLITVDAGAGDDTVRLGAADRAYAAPVFGTSQFDTRAVTQVTLGAGDDILWGTASERDMAIFEDGLADVAFAAIAGGVRVTTATEGTDELYGVEFVQLAGLRYALDALV
jgi:predicted extracellular nuclease